MCFSKHCWALNQIQEFKGVVFKAYEGNVIFVEMGVAVSSWSYIKSSVTHLCFWSLRQYTNIEYQWACYLIQYLFIKLHKRPSQLVCFPCGSPGCLTAQAMLENWLQVCWVDSLQLLPVWITKCKAAEKLRDMVAKKMYSITDWVANQRYRVVKKRKKKKKKLNWIMYYVKKTKQNILFTAFVSYSLYGADAYYRGEARCEWMAPDSTPCWHWGHHLNVLKTHPLKIFIIETLIG